MNQNKQKRRLVTFKFKGIGYINDDFVMNRKSCIIHYTLDRQKKRRGYLIHFNNEFLNDPIATPEFISKLVFNSFKTSLNIKHT